MKFTNAHERNEKSSGAAGTAARMYQRFLSTGNGTASHGESIDHTHLLPIAEDDANPRLIKRNRRKPLRRTSSGALPIDFGFTVDCSVK